MTRPRLLPLAAWLCVATVAALVALASGQAAGADAGEQDPPAQATDRGDTLYTTHCARCHGADGLGGQSEAAPALVGMPVALVDLVLRTNRMPPAHPDGSGVGPVDWDDERRMILLAHLTEEFDLEGTLPDPSEGQADVGREVFATHCAACHGYTADGGVAGGGAFTPRLVGLDAVTIAEAIRMGPFEMPAFAEEQISDDEVAHVAAYIDEVAHEAGTPLGLAELNPVFLAAFVGLLALAAVASCLYISGRVVMFPDQEAPAEESPDEQPPQGRTRA